MGWPETGSDFEEDGLGDTVGIVLHLVVPEAEDFPAQTFEKAGSRLVSLDPFEMLAAVELDSQPRLAAGKIEDKIADPELAGETWAVAREPRPEQAFLRRRFVAKLPSEAREPGWDPGHFESMFQ